VRGICLRFAMAMAVILGVTVLVPVTPVSAAQNYKHSNRPTTIIASDIADVTVPTVGSTKARHDSTLIADTSDRHSDVAVISFGFTSKSGVPNGTPYVGEQMHIYVMTHVRDSSVCIFRTTATAPISERPSQTLPPSSYLIVCTFVQPGWNSIDLAKVVGNDDFQNSDISDAAFSPSNTPTYSIYGLGVMMPSNDENWVASYLTIETASTAS